VILHGDERLPTQHERVIASRLRAGWIYGKIKPEMGRVKKDRRSLKQRAADRKVA